MRGDDGRGGWGEGVARGAGARLRRELDSEKLLFHVGLGSRPRACTRADRTLSALCSRHDRHGTDVKPATHLSMCSASSRISW